MTHAAFCVHGTCDAVFSVRGFTGSLSCIAPNVVNSRHLWAYRAKLATLTLAAGHTLGQILKKDGIRSYFNSFADVDTDDAQGVH